MSSASAWRQYLDEPQTPTSVPEVLSETIPNGSFEEADGALPRSWFLVDGKPGDSTEWMSSGGVDDGRCLRISPRGGGASWRCSPVRVVGGAEYLFRCAMKREGNRHWAHACRISWATLVFHDGSGQPCRETSDSYAPFVTVRCRKTDGWVEGWRYLRAPAEARTLHVGFRIKRGEPPFDDPYGFRKFWHGDIDTGNWWIDDVRLERMPLAVTAGKGCLRIEIPEGTARVWISNGGGKTFIPPGVISYQWGGGCFHALREHVEATLPPGEYTIEAMRGFQRRPFRHRVRIVEGKQASVTVELPRVANLPAEGWYEGDHHNHLSFHGDTRHPLMTIDDVCRVARGEGLDFLSFCGEIVDQHAYADWREAGKPREGRPDGAVELPDFISSVSHEVTQDLLGHICLVNAPGHVLPGHPWWITPTNADIIEGIRKSDRCGTEGAVALAHPYDSLTAENTLEVLSDPTRTGMNRELPVDVALGLADTMDFLAVEEQADLDLRFRDYARLLNLSLRIGVSGASDAYADQGTEILGSLRTAVHAEAFHMNAIARGYRQQETIATNGPILQFSANSQPIGATVSGPDVALNARAYSNWGITRLEVLAGGEIIADATPGSDGWAHIDTRVYLGRSGWLIARAWGSSHPMLNALPASVSQRYARGQWAVTSPIYVMVSDKPLVPRHEDAEYFVQWIDASCEAIRKRVAVLEGKGPYGPVMHESDVKRALDLFARGRSAYRRFL